MLITMLNAKEAPTIIKLEGNEIAEELRELLRTSVEKVKTWSFEEPEEDD